MLVVGAGGAGLIAALAAEEAGARVTVAAAAPLGKGCNTAVSGGGFMMATDAFSIKAHIDLTLAAGRLLNNPSLVYTLCEEANDARLWLEAGLGCAFNPKHNGQGYWFTGGGAGLFERLSARVAATPTIEVLDGIRVVSLTLTDGRCCGAVGHTPTGDLVPLPAGATVLATGGYAGLYTRHDNPGTPVGEGVFLALQAGAVVRDLEFVQFYPLGLAEPALPTFMAFRPFPPQARVVNRTGHSLTEIFLDTDDLNLAVGNHRDAFSQAIEQERQEGPVYLDLTGVDWSQLDRWFSLQFLRRYDFPWETQPAQIAPIAHHTMGGVAVDTWGRTTVTGLYAVGEVAAGLHGANRLGSNSLSECLVFGRRAGRHAAKQRHRVEPFEVGDMAAVRADVSASAALEDLQQACWRQLGITRDEAGLDAASRRFRHDGGGGVKLACARQIAQAVVRFSRARRESRGAHHRSDFPREDPAQSRSLMAKGFETPAFVKNEVDLY